MKILKFLESHARITKNILKINYSTPESQKITKFIEFHARTTKIKKNKLCLNHENHEIHKIPRKNNENRENLIIPCKNNENH